MNALDFFLKRLLLNYSIRSESRLVCIYLNVIDSSGQLTSVQHHAFRVIEVLCEHLLSKSVQHDDGTFGYVLRKTNGNV
jgi:hypothetical protein